jgi:hypothetical protein
MPAVSKTQQRLMGLSYGVRKFMDTNGKDGIDPDSIKSAYRETIVEIANNMKKKDLKDFASTKHNKLPEEVEESEIPTIYSYLKPESNKPNKKSKSARVSNLVDYREFISNKK